MAKIPNDWHERIMAYTRAHSREVAERVAACETEDEAQAALSKFFDDMCADLERYIEATQGVAVSAPEGIQ